MSKGSVYLNDINRVFYDVNSLVYYAEKNDTKNIEVYADYITKEVKLLVELIQTKKGAQNDRK